MEAPQHLQASDRPAGCPPPAPASAHAPPGLSIGKAGLRISARPLVPRYTDFDPTCDDGQAWQGSAAFQESKGKPLAGTGSASHTPSPIDVYEPTMTTGVAAPVAAALSSGPSAEVGGSAGPAYHQSLTGSYVAEASPGRRAAHLSIQQSAVGADGSHSYQATSVMYVQAAGGRAETGGGMFDPSSGLLDEGAAGSADGFGLLDESDVFAPKWDAPFRCPLSVAGGRGFLGAMSLLHPHPSPRNNSAAMSDGADGSAVEGNSASRAAVPLSSLAGSLDLLSGPCASSTDPCSSSGTASAANTTRTTTSCLRGTLKIQLPRLPLAAGQEARQDDEGASRGSLPTSGRGSDEPPRSVRLNLQADVLTFTPKTYMSLSSTSSSTTASPCCSEPGSDAGGGGCHPSCSPAAQWQDEGAEGGGGVAASSRHMTDDGEEEDHGDGNDGARGCVSAALVIKAPPPLSLKPALPASTGLVLSRVRRRGAARTVRPGDDSETPGSSEEARGSTGSGEEGDDPMSGSASSLPSTRGTSTRRKYANELAPNMMAGTGCHAGRGTIPPSGLPVHLNSGASATALSAGGALGLPPLSLSAAPGGGSGRPAGLSLSLRVGATASAAPTAPLRLPPGAAHRCADSDSDASDEAGSIRRIKPPRSTAAATGSSSGPSSSMLGLGGAPALSLSVGASSEAVMRSRGDSGGEGGLRLSFGAAAATGGGGPAPAPGSPGKQAASLAAAAYQYFYYAASLPAPVLGGLDVGVVQHASTPAPPTAVPPAATHSSASL